MPHDTSPWGVRLYLAGEARDDPDDTQVCSAPCSTMRQAGFGDDLATGWKRETPDGEGGAMPKPFMRPDLASR